MPDSAGFKRAMSSPSLSLLGQRSNSNGNIAGSPSSSPSPFWMNNGTNVATTPLVVSIASSGGRKHSKTNGATTLVGMVNLGCRDRQKLLSCVLRVAWKKRLGILLVALLACASALMLFNVLHMDSFRPVTDWENDGMLAHKAGIFLRMPKNATLAKVADTRSRDLRMPNNVTLAKVGVSRSRDPFPVIRFGIPRWPELFVGPPLPLDHPCQGFVIPPPPADKKRTGPRPCPVCYLPVEKAIKSMPANASTSPTVNSLTFVVEADTFASSVQIQSYGGSDFGGHPTLEQRNKYFQVEESMQVHCGFAKGHGPGVGVGFDIEKDDLIDMEKCAGIVVASAIFGNYDTLQQPRNISEEARKTVCFYMFIDNETHQSFEKDSLADNNTIGLWRIVVVNNLPYLDARRNGKVPKLLLHRLFPNARFSVWIDGKLELVVDPYQILERFLWRTKDTLAISQHYKRFDVFEEAEANKAAGKYVNASIEAQVEFYRKEGLASFSSAKFPITSDVPEGCVIVREHIPITNLFMCLWFNEVDRFTPRDQLSFAIVRDKLMSQLPWKVNMFRDCERRNFVVQAYHRDVLEQMKAIMIIPPPPPSHLPPVEVKLAIRDMTYETPPKTNITTLLRQSNSSRRGSRRRRRERRGKQRRHASKSQPG